MKEGIRGIQDSIAGVFHFFLAYGCLAVPAALADPVEPDEDPREAEPLPVDARFAQEAAINAPVPESGDHFGRSISISGDTLVVGAPEASSDASLRFILMIDGEIVDLNSKPGSAYVFVRSGTQWIEQAHLAASDGDASDLFGHSVAMCGDTIVVGAPGEDSNATGINGDGSNNDALDSGAAYVYVRRGTRWVEQACLKPSNTGADDQFGWSVAISGDTVVVGSIGEDSAGGIGNGPDNSVENSGAAYVFVRDGGTWIEQAYLKASNSNAADSFGQSVGVTEDTILVGSPGAEDGSGAVHVFGGTGTEWREHARLRAPNANSADQFGMSVTVSGQTVVIGAPGEGSDAAGVNGDQNNDRAPGAGAAYVFERIHGAWNFQAYLKASNTGDLDQFGHAVALSGETLTVGAPQEDSGTTPVGVGLFGDSQDNSGAVYVFVRRGSQWSQQAYIKASDIGPGSGFGKAVAVSGSTIVGGAAQETGGFLNLGGGVLFTVLSLNQGTTYTFDLVAESLEQVQSISRLPEGMRLKMPLAFGRRVGIEFSTDLEAGTWIDLGNFFEVDGELQFLDPDLIRLGRPRGYYRAFLRPY